MIPAQDGVTGVIADQTPEVWLTLFSGRHAIVVAGFTALMVALIVAGRCLAANGRELAFRRTLGVIGLILVVGYNTWWLWPTRFVITSNLPLHVCDLAMILAAISMLIDRRLLTTIVYFAGIGLSTQAFLTPVEEAGPSHPRFWLFWLAHSQIVGVAIYHVVVVGYRPRVRDLTIALIIGVAYIMVILPFDLAVDGNYAFVGDSAPEDTPGVVSLLGPWPLRVPLVMLIGSLALVLAWLPWAIAGRLSSEQRRAGSGSANG